jgi:hypothetical protein
MRDWGIRIAILISAIVMNVLEGMIVPRWTSSARLNIDQTILDEIILGFLMGLVICVIHWGFRRRYQKHLKAAVDELNHHVRNAMQTILNQQAMCPHCDPDALDRTMERVDWALREVLPPEIQPRRAPEPHSSRVQFPHIKAG